jgi:hypothetical protein
MSAFPNVGCRPEVKENAASNFDLSQRLFNKKV